MMMTTRAVWKTFSVIFCLFSMVEGKRGGGGDGGGGGGSGGGTRVGGGGDGGEEKPLDP